MSSLDSLVRNAQTIAVVCNQWGDTGKGKFSDYFADRWADVIVRGTGGNNAGHTVVINGIERIFHLIPAGIVYDEQGKVNILGQGMVLDLEVLVGEMNDLDSQNVTYDNMMISEDAMVILPFEIARDQAKNVSQKGGGIGSTGRGIGPAYGDKVLRKGVKVRDLYNKDVLAGKIERLKDYYLEQDIDTEEVIAHLTPFAERIKSHVRDTNQELHNLLAKGKKVLLEGAQGLLLSIEFGTYPYVTSSDCSLNGTASGAGLNAQDVDLPFGIIKFPVMTRVGNGPMVGEIGAEGYELYCHSEGYNMLSELQTHGISHNVISTEEPVKVRYDHSNPKIIKMMNSKDMFIKSVGIRLAMGEYGATTGRPRRVGWTDAVAAKYARQINGPLFILTKVDAVAGLDEFALNFGYTREGTTQTSFTRDSDYLYSAKPQLEFYPGLPDISDRRQYGQIPYNLRRGMRDFEAFTGGQVKIISVGPEPQQTIIR